MPMANSHLNLAMTADTASTAANSQRPNMQSTHVDNVCSLSALVASLITVDCVKHALQAMPCLAGDCHRQCASELANT